MKSQKRYVKHQLYEVFDDGITLIQPKDMDEGDFMNDELE